MSRRKRAKRDRDRAKVRLERARLRYYRSPSAWSHACQGCDAEHSTVHRPEGRVYLCDECAERRGVKARVSQAARDGGARTDSTVRVRHVDPATMDW